MLRRVLQVRSLSPIAGHLSSLTPNLAVYHDSGFSLAPLNNLRSCELMFKLHAMCVAENCSLPWIDALVCQVLSSSLSTIVIEIWADDMQDLRALDSECVSAMGH